jgi:hypothetical protein
MTGMGAIRRSFAGAVLLALGCSGSTTTPGTGAPSAAPPIAEADFAATYVQATCAVLQTCCVAAGVAFDAPACPQTLTAPTSRPPYQTAYDPARAGQCVAMIRGLGASCNLTETLSRQIGELCAAVYAGQQPIGARCGGRQDCAGGYDGVSRCVFDQGNDGGVNVTCQPVTRGNAGDQCVGPPLPAPLTGTVYTDCATGLICGGQSTCVAPQPAGQPCSPGIAICASDLACIAGTCTPKQANGAACSSYNECQSGACVGAVCVASMPFTAKTCTVRAASTSTTTSPTPSDAGGATADAAGD